MSNPIKLNAARKARARAEKRRQADENSVKFGRTKAQKAAEKAEAERAKRQHEGHRRPSET